MNDRTDSMASTASSSSGGTTAPKPTALPTEEALQILLAPDGYYKYLAIYKPTLDIHGPTYKAAMSAGGADTGSEASIDLDQVKKNYRRLSLKHHPDRKTGDAETFRVLNRAKIVLSSPKLRREYDLIGLDLEDDAEDEGGHHEEPASPSSNAENGEDNGEAHREDSGKESKTETVMGHLASVTLAAVLQVVVRTALMGLTSVLISRYTILTVVAIGALTFLTAKMYSAVKKTLGPDIKPNFATLKEALSPMVIALGVFCMYRGRRFLVASSLGDADNGVVGDSTATAELEYLDWTWTFLIGETIVMTCFFSNSFENRPTKLLLIPFTIVSILFSLWLRGRFWRYATILGFEGIIAIFVVLAFPIMEMILESIVDEKMRKVGEKIRAHDVRMKELLKRKRQEGGSSS